MLGVVLFERGTVTNQVAWVACRLNSFSFTKKKKKVGPPLILTVSNMSPLTVSDSDNVVLPFGKQLAANGNSRNSLNPRDYLHLYLHSPFCREKDSRQGSTVTTAISVVQSGIVRKRSPQALERSFLLYVALLLSFSPFILALN